MGLSMKEIYWGNDYEGKKGKGAQERVGELSDGSVGLTQGEGKKEGRKYL